MLNKKACIKDTITGRTQNGFVSQRMDYVYIQSVYRIFDLHRDINTFVYLFTFHCSQLIFSKKVLSWHGDLYQYVRSNFVDINRFYHQEHNLLGISR